MPGDPLCQLLELLDQHGSEIYDGARSRVCLEMRGHIGVILDGMQIGPRQHVLTRQGVTILRLMHVPEQHDGQACRWSHLLELAGLTGRRRIMSAVTSTTLFSVRSKRSASSPLSSPIWVPSGISQPSSRMAPVIVQLRPMETFGSRTERSMREPSSICTLENTIDWRTTAPEMMHPPETIELIAMPRRLSSSRMNFAGG